MEFTTKELQETYHFRHASDSEDAVIQQFLSTIQDLPARNNKLDFLFKKAAPVIVAAVFLFCLYAGFTNGFTAGLLILPFMLAAIYGVQIFQVFRQKWNSSGIRYNYHKHSNHFLCSSAVCSAKEVESGLLGHRRYLLAGKLPGSRTIEKVPVIKTHYDTIQPGTHFYIAAAELEGRSLLFAIPQSFLASQGSAARKSETADIKQSLRRMDSRDRDLVTTAQKERVRIRHKLYLRNQLVILALAALFFLYQIIKVNEAGITLGLFMLLACSLMFLSNYVQDRGVAKALLKYDSLFCADAVASVTEVKNSPAISFKGRGSQLLHTSTLKDDTVWFQSGDKALLVYFDETKPTAYKIN